MPSPFPGMNPYLEAAGVWQDFHLSFIVKAADALAEQIAPKYFVTISDQPPLDPADVQWAKDFVAEHLATDESR